MLSLEPDNNESSFLPVTNFQWTFNGHVLHCGGRISLGSYNITITNVKRADGGVYGVTVETDAGRASSNFTLDVLCELTSSKVGWMHDDLLMIILAKIPTSVPHFHSSIIQPFDAYWSI